MSKQAVLVTIKSDDKGRIVHIHDLNSRTTISYIDNHVKGLIDVEEHGNKRIVANLTDLLEEFHFECYEFRPNPNGQNLKLFCKDNFHDAYIVYTVVAADPTNLYYSDSQTPDNLTHIQTDGD